MFPFSSDVAWVKLCLIFEEIFKGVFSAFLAPSHFDLEDPFEVGSLEDVGEVGYRLFDCLGAQLVVGEANDERPSQLEGVDLEFDDSNACQPVQTHKGKMTFKLVHSLIVYDSLRSSIKLISLVKKRLQQ